MSMKMTPKPRPMPMRTCIIRGCGKPVPRLKVKDLPRWLCEEHYAPVSDQVVDAWIENILRHSAA